MFARCRIACLISAVLLSGGVGRAEDAKPDMQVSVEVKFVTIPENMFQELKGQGFVRAQNKESHARERMTFLTDAQVSRFLETVQQDIRSSVMQAPKLTSFNGRNEAINIVEDQSFVTHLNVYSRDDDVRCVSETEVVPLGIRIALRPVISADRRSVRLRFGLKWDDLVSGAVSRTPITTTVGTSAESSPKAKPRTFTHYIQQPRINRLRVERTLVIPDGNTAVLTGLMRQVEVSRNVGPDILSEIPYLGQLFRKTTHETHHLLVLVTPRILVTPEPEVKRSKDVPE